MLTPDIEAAIAWFERTHVLDVVALGQSRWRRSCLPSGAELDRQDALLMQQIECVADILNRLMSERTTKGDEQQERQRFHDAARARRG